MGSQTGLQVGRYSWCVVNLLISGATTRVSGRSVQDHASAVGGPSVKVGKKGLGRDRLIALEQMWASNAKAPFCSDGESELEFR